MTARPIQRRIDRLPTPPATDEGEIVDVDFEPTPSTRYAADRPCHECGADLDINTEDYVEATVRLDEPSSLTNADYTTLYPQFCSRECWRSWASAEKG